MTTSIPLLPFHLWPLLEARGLFVGDRERAMLVDYMHLLKRLNAHTNLVSRKSVDTIWDVHIPHSLSFLLAAPMERCSRILDLGTGGGLPGIPLSIVCKNVTFVLLDSTAKKVRAVREMVASLSLSNTEVVLGRAEQIGKLPGYAHSFDAVIARSVAPLYELAGWGKPFLRLIKKSGTPDRLSDSPFPAIIATKGGNIEGEIGRVRKRFPRINCSLVKLDHLNLSGDRKDDKSIIVLRFPSI